MAAYDHKKIEKKWQDFWAQNKIYSTPDAVPGKDNFFLLVEFPYPSGNLHVGHWYAFAVPDILARAMRMQGKNVMYPIGFDAFGLPAENAAIKNKLNPRDWTEKNIAYMTKQIESMGTSFDWSRKVSTIDPSYYKWTQWLFLQLYKKGLVYQKETAVNWCPTDKTVLANEQVVDGKCERCGAEVVQRQMLQWNIKITDYADRLIDDLAALDWPEQIKESQRNWIGRSEGAEIDFALDLGKKYTYIILHGWMRGDERIKTLGWYKAKLEEAGHSVILPDLPNPKMPREEEQVRAALECANWDENTIVIGHSLGAIVAMKALMKSGAKIAGLILTAPAAPPGVPGMGERPFHATFDWRIDYDAVREQTGYRTVVSDIQETARVPYLQELARHIDAKLVEIKGQAKHFVADTEPDVLVWLRPTIRVFTTRPDTLYGATYLVLAPEHPWVTLALQHKTVLKNNDEVQSYVVAASKKTELERQTDQKDKTGVKLEGVTAINPATGERIPLYVADYVLGHYGTGAIMAVPAHDERDYDFAKKFDLPIKQVVRPVFGAENRGKGEMVFRETVSAVVRSKDGSVMLLDWPQNKWITTVIGGIEKGESPEAAAEREVLEETGYKAKAVFVSPIAIESYFYADHKKEWRARLDHPVLLELLEDEPVAVADEETAKHKPFWVEPEKALQTDMYGNNKLAVELALGRVSAYTKVTHGEIQELANSDEFNGTPVADAKSELTARFGREKKTYKLRDWIVSRQRYWGVPIPMVHCEKCGAQPVPDAQLPVELPPVDDYLPEGSGKSPLAKVKSFVETTCPTCGGAAERETDTLDTFVDSSWYFIRYTDPLNSTEFAARERQDAWMPIDLYSGGAEHTTMHLLYSRFWHKALFDCGLVKDAEPYARRMNRSLIMGPDGQKMSKSRGNVIDPDEVVEKLGADTVRMYLAFIGPYNEVASYPWNPDGVVGVRRFLERVWKIGDKLVERGGVETSLHRAIKKVSEDIPKLKFNTAISALMILVNDAEKQGMTKDQYARLVRLIAPFAPHMAEELWHNLGNTASVHQESWPTYEEKFLQDENIVYAIQIDGKTRGEVSVPADADKAAVEAAAREAVAARLEGQSVARVVVVPKRLVNFVLES